MCYLIGAPPEIIVNELRDGSLIEPSKFFSKVFPKCSEKGIEGWI